MPNPWGKVRGLAKPTLERKATSLAPPQDKKEKRRITKKEGRVLTKLVIKKKEKEGPRGLAQLMTDTRLLDQPPITIVQGGCLTRHQPTGHKGTC